MYLVLPYLGTFNSENAGFVSAKLMINLDIFPHRMEIWLHDIRKHTILHYYAVFLNLKKRKKCTLLTTIPPTFHGHVLRISLCMTQLIFLFLLRLILLLHPRGFLQKEMDVKRQ